MYLVMYVYQGHMDNTLQMGLTAISIMAVCKGSDPREGREAIGVPRTVCLEIKRGSVMQGAIYLINI